jgi:cell division septum initiation protein DivIVA
MGWPKFPAIRDTVEHEIKLAGGLLQEADVIDAEREAAEIREAAHQAASETVRGAEVLAKRRLDELLAKANIGLVESKAERMAMVRNARRSASALLELVNTLYRDYKMIVEKILGHVDQLEPKELIAFVGILSRISKESTDTATVAMALEDREYGRPDVIVAHTQLALPEALAEIDEAKALADLIRQGERVLVVEEHSDIIDTTAEVALSKVS